MKGLGVMKDKEGTLELEVKKNSQMDLVTVFMVEVQGDSTEKKMVIMFMLEAQVGYGNKSLN